MNDQEYTLRRDMLRDAIRKTEADLARLRDDLYNLEKSRK